MKAWVVGNGVGIFKEYNVFRPAVRPKARVALIYPSIYRASITNLFTHIAYFYLYEKLNNVLVDRFTLDNPSRGAVSGLPLRSFDYALLSIGFEFDVVGAVKILRSGGVEPLKRLRREGPVVVAGGPPATANPVSLSGLADVVFAGEGEVLLKALADAVERGKSLECLLESLESLGARESAFTGSEERVRRARVDNLDNAYIPKALIRSFKYEPIYGDGYYVEVSRGCRWLCPFCMESHVTYPQRFRSLGKVLNAIREGLEYVGVKRVVFYSLSFFDYPQADKLLENLIEENFRYSIPSVRYHTLSIKRVDLMRLGGQQTLTLAPETGVSYAASLIGKELDEGLLTSLTQHALSTGMSVKFYIMFGLPGEGRDAGAAAAELVRRCVGRSRVGGRVRVSVNPLVPKASTPLQYAPLIGRDEFRAKLRDLRKGLKGLGIPVDSYDWRWAWAQAVLSLGGEWVADLAVRWSEYGPGIGFFRRALEDVGVDPCFVLRKRDPSRMMPPDIVEWELSRVLRRRGEELLKLYPD